MYVSNVVRMSMLTTILFLSACRKVDRAIDVAEKGVDAIDKAVHSLERGIDTFDDGIDVLSGLKENLDNEVYKDQVQDLIVRTGEVAKTTTRTAGQVAENTLKASVDFTRERLIADLKNLKGKMLGQPMLPRVPVLSNAQSPKIDFKDSSRQTITIVGWNLDVAKKDPNKYRLTVQNATSQNRVVDAKLVSYQGQYSLTVDVSSSGVELQYHDKKLVFEGYTKPFELSIVNSDPPPRPPPPQPVSLSPSAKVNTSAKHASLLRENADVGTDDWTLVQVAYQLRIGQGHRSVEAKIEWDVFEGEKDKKLKKTHIRNTRDWHQVWSLPPPYDRVISIGAGIDGNTEKWYRGKQHGPKSFPNVGGLQDVAVTFDGGGGDDLDDQALSAVLRFTVSVIDEN